jgi:hypothetical protein
VTGRALVTARCHRRGCKLARVLAAEHGLMIEVMLAAAARTASGIGRGRGTRSFTEPFDASMIYTATCDCGGGYLINCAELDRDIGAGVAKRVIRPTM